MKIDFVHLQNFRKLKDCRIEFAQQQTLFVGANNSGKTTAMDALMLFLKQKSKFTTRDFTLSNWKDINKLGEKWCSLTAYDPEEFSIDKWAGLLPTLDVWLKVEHTELQHVHRLIPTLSWKGGLLGVRLRLQPVDIELFYQEFTAAQKQATELTGKPEKGKKFKMWPSTLWEFLDEKGNLSRFFKVQTFLLDPALHDKPQEMDPLADALEGDVFSGLIKIDIINAQRGFSDSNSESQERSENIKNLGSQLRSYYDKHLNPSVNPTADDIAALKAISSAKEIFDESLKTAFKDSLKELEILNYPGFGNPSITLSSKFNSLDSLTHESAVQYALEEGLSLPEKYNGLGYQNLISIIFKLIRFRDEWMQVGKGFDSSGTTEVVGFEPLHLVLIEEPEAHLHAQVQQVFINKAYQVLRKHDDLLEGSLFTTQLIISTHSSHIAHEADFTALRYFKRSQPKLGMSQTTTVVNLSETFGEDTATTKFAKRYLKTTHCDLFFADAVIMVEGPAERMLVPSFVRRYEDLCNCYLSILEIGGSHAHTLRPLIEDLGILCLVITDLDAVQGRSKVQPDLGKGYNSGNSTLKTWLPGENSLDKLLAMKEADWISKNGQIRVVYQTKISFKEGKKDVPAYPYTFEDSLVLTNKKLFSEMHAGKGLLLKMCTAAKQKNTALCAKELYEVITDETAKKAEFALELLFMEDPKALEIPAYIASGLSWLEGKLSILKKPTKGK
ncbi:ATP-dependent endonuclease [Pedobacter sp. BMA]|uniref:ATP-dependent endonuclease n=1 Tax=Pedobacter sp. BMA TaxID=1663685 RepID=UPI00064A29C4|nr:AAA family ATPase [Pedobacter sp. BMA]KLT63925.1 ATP-dependent endonuclease [Pedobacter sp. BMA]